MADSGPSGAGGLPTVLDIYERRLSFYARRLLGTEKDSGLPAATAVDTDDVAVHGLLEPRTRFDPSSYPVTGTSEGPEGLNALPALAGDRFTPSTRTERMVSRTSPQ